MKPISDLFELIHSLTPTEKRYFKLYASSLSQHKHKKYLLLFDAIAKQKIYHENALIEKFKGEKFTKQFGVAKNYLFHLILRSLREYHSSKHAEFSIQNTLQEARLLFEKGLKEASRNTLEKAKKLAQESEQPLYAMQAIYNQEQWFNEEPKEHQQSLVRQKEELLAQVHQMDFWKRGIQELNRYLAHPTGRYTLPYKDLAYYFNATQLKVADPEQFPVQFTLNTHFQLLKTIVNDDEKQLTQTATKTSHTLRNNLPSFKTYRAEMFHLLYQLGLTLLHVDAQNEWELLYSEVKSENNTKKGTTDLLIILEHLKLKQAIINANDTKAEEIANKLSSIEQVQTQSLGNEGLQVDMIYDLAYAYFIRADYNKSLKWLVPLTSKEQGKKGSDSFIYAHILALIAHFESGHYQVLRYLHDQTVNLIQKSNKLFEYEMRYLNFMRTVRKFETKEQKESFYKGLLDRLQQAEDSKRAGRNNEGITCRIDFKDWVKAKMKGEPFNKLLSHSKDREYSIPFASPFEI